MNNQRFRWGIREKLTLLFFGVTRTLWLGVMPLAPPGTAGLVLIIAADTLLLL